MEQGPMPATMPAEGSQTSPLVSFLGARLDEDETAALAAVVVASRWEVVNYDHGTEWGVRDAGDGWVADRVDQDTAAHIARHDPARAIREVEADRKLLAAYDEAVNGPAADLGVADALEAVIRDRAAVYSGHPDYDPAWAG